MDEKLKSKFIALYCMILADGIIDIREMETLYRIGRENYGIEAETINNAVRECGTSFNLPEEPNEKIALLYNLAEIALADDNLDPSEKSLIKKYALRMGFLEENIDGIIKFLIEKARQKASLEQVLEEINN